MKLPLSVIIRSLTLCSCFLRSIVKESSVEQANEETEIKENLIREADGAKRCNSSGSFVEATEELQLL